MDKVVCVFNVFEINKKINLYIEYKNTIAFTKNQYTYIKNDNLNLPLNYINLKIKTQKGNFLYVISQCKIPDFLSIYEANRIVRKELLLIQDIISFLADDSITVFDNVYSIVSQRESIFKAKQMKFLYKRKQFTKDLEKIIQSVDNENELLFKLLDRWRKACFLLNEAIESNLYFDESFLIFFKIIEIIANKFFTLHKKDYKKFIKYNLIKNNFWLFKATYLNKNQIDEEINYLYKKIEEKIFTLSFKIKFFLDKNRLLNNNTEAFIDSLIKIRNNIAHANIHNSDFIWPLPPFLNIYTSPTPDIYILKVLTSRIIAAYFNLKSKDIEWNNCKLLLPPSLDTINNFLNNKILLKENEILYGNKYNLTIEFLFKVFISNYKELNTQLPLLESKLKPLYKNIILNEHIAPDIFNISLLFSDSKDIEMSDKAKFFIKTIIINNWHSWSNYKDPYIYLNKLSIKLKWYKKFIEEMACHNLHKKYPIVPIFSNHIQP